MDRDDLFAVFNLGHEVNLSPRWATESKGCFAVVMGYSKIAHSEDIHADKSIDARMERYFSDAHHGKHDSIRERDVD
jgi:hypothetical protein